MVETFFSLFALLRNREELARLWADRLKRWSLVLSAASMALVAGAVLFGFCTHVSLGAIVAFVVATRYGILVNGGILTVVLLLLIAVGVLGRGQTLMEVIPLPGTYTIMAGWVLALCAVLSLWLAVLAGPEPRMDTGEALFCSASLIGCGVLAFSELDFILKLLAWSWSQEAPLMAVVTTLLVLGQALVTLRLV